MIKKITILFNKIIIIILLIQIYFTGNKHQIGNNYKNKDRCTINKQ